MSQLSNNATSDLANPNGLQLPAKPRRATRSDKGKSKGRRQVAEVFAAVLDSLKTLHSPEERAKVLALVDTYYQNESK